MQQLYLLYSCDEWKGNACAICVTASVDKLKAAIECCIQKDEMEYSDGRTFETAEDQISLLEKDFVEFDMRIINDRLGYGYFTIINDGEFI
jgi:hypothetical protein